MKICPVGAEMFDVDGMKNRWRDGQAWWSQKSLFAILQTCQKGCTGNTLHVLLSLHLLFWTVFVPINISRLIKLWRKKWFWDI